jgi:hypothetical protein
MPLQNRVLPTGEIVADPARGMFTGNRGCLHDDQRRLGRARWKGRAWIICALEYKGWRRVVMTPRTWTELFFLDEAVALAAGHRPCALCRRTSFRAFQAASGGLRAPDIDASLHAARLEGREQRRFVAELQDLPDGSFVDLEGPHLIWQRQAYPYSPAGYGPPKAVGAGMVTVMTPAPTVLALRAGYLPVVALADADLPRSGSRP